MPGHFAQTDPVLGRLVRAGPAPVHFAPVERLRGDLARAGSLSAHFARAGPVGAFSGAAPVVGHLAQPVLEHPEGDAWAQPVPVDIARPPKLGIP